MRPDRREALILGAVGVGAAAAGALIGAFALQSQTGAAALLSHTFVDLEGKPRRLVEWQGRVLVCNFWATWCAPCREEIPLFISAQQQYGAKILQIVGIGIDRADKIGEFSAKFGITYPLLVADATAMDTMKQLGNQSGGLPFTVVLDRGGAVAKTRLGALKAGELDLILAPLLR